MLAGPRLDEESVLGSLAAASEGAQIDQRGGASGIEGMPWLFPFQREPMERTRTWTPDSLSMRASSIKGGVSSP